VVWCFVWCGAVLCGTLSSVHACMFVVCVCVCVCVCACVCVYSGVLIYTCAHADREGGVYEISHKWNLDVAENCVYLKTFIISTISFDTQ